MIPGDRVTTGNGRHYVVRSVDNDGTMLLTPVRPGPRRRRTHACTARLTRTFQLHTSWALMNDARRYMAERRDPELTAGTLGRAAHFLTEAARRGEDSPAEVKAARDQLSLIIQEV